MKYFLLGRKRIIIFSFSDTRMRYGKIKLRIHLMNPLASRENRIYVILFGYVSLILSPKRFV